MAPEEAQNAPRRRGRPPGSKTRTRRKSAVGGDLVKQLNAMVAQLITKNKQLQRQVTKLTQRAGKTAANKNVERELRTISRRVQRALGSTTKRGRKTAPTDGRKRKPATRRRRTS